MKLQTIIIGAALMLSTGVFADTNKVASPGAVAGDNALYRRVYVIQKPENLKRVQGLDAKKPVQELFLDYLKKNGVVLKTPKFVRLRETDSKNVAFEVRGTLSDLDEVESLVGKLD